MNKYQSQIDDFYNRFHSKMVSIDHHSEHVAEFADHCNSISDFELADELMIEDEDYDQISKIRKFISDGADQFLLSLLDQTFQTMGAF